MQSYLIPERNRLFEGRPQMAGGHIELHEATKVGHLKVNQVYLLEKSNWTRILNRMPDLEIKIDLTFVTYSQTN